MMARPPQLTPGSESSLKYDNSLKYENSAQLNNHKQNKKNTQQNLSFSKSINKITNIYIYILNGTITNDKKLHNNNGNDIKNLENSGAKREKIVKTQEESNSDWKKNFGKLKKQK